MKSREPQFHLRGSSELRGRDFHSLQLGSTIFDFLSWRGFRSLLSYQPRQRIKRNKRKKNKAPRKKEEKKNGERRKTDWDQVPPTPKFDMQTQPGIIPILNGQNFTRVLIGMNKVWGKIKAYLKWVSIGAVGKPFPCVGEVDE